MTATPRFRRAIFPIASALFAGREGPPPRERLEWLAEDLADFLTHAGPRPRVLFRIGVAALNWIVPLLLLRAPLPWQRLEGRDETLARIEGSALGLSMLLVKTLMCVVYYEHPDAERQTGYDGRCLIEGDRATSSTTGSTPSDVTTHAPSPATRNASTPELV